MSYFLHFCVCLVGIVEQMELEHIAVLGNQLVVGLAYGEYYGVTAVHCKLGNVRKGDGNAAASYCFGADACFTGSKLSFNVLGNGAESGVGCVESFAALRCLADLFLLPVGKLKYCFEAAAAEHAVFVISEAVGAGAAACSTEVPHLVQNAAPSARALPQFLQNITDSPFTFDSFCVIAASIAFCVVMVKQGLHL